jgi:hypothetical protein
MKFVKLYKVIKVPLANIKQKMRAEGNYKPIDMDLFVDSQQEKISSAMYN